MNINYCFDIIPSPKQFLALYRMSQNILEDENESKIRLMLSNSTLIVTAWQSHTLVGISRSVTDWYKNYYLAELLIMKSDDTLFVGNKLIELTIKKVIEQDMNLLLPLSTVIEYYPQFRLAQNEYKFLEMNKTIAINKLMVTI